MKTLTATLGLLSLAAAAHAAPVQWSAASGGNDHYYEFVTTATTWDSASADAQSRTYDGLTGHLLTLTSQEEKDFVNTSLLSGANTWLGAQRDGSSNAFIWAVGPEAGLVFYDGGLVGGVYSSFWGGEPNGQFSGENHVEMWGNNWNDMPGNQARAYVVEYSAVTAAPVPLPASGLMLVAGLGALGIGRRRRKAG